MKRYVNCKPAGYVETVDELNSSDFENYKTFRSELARIKSEYIMAFGCEVWISSRATREWRTK